MLEEDLTEVMVNEEGGGAGGGGGNGEEAWRGRKRGEEGVWREKREGGVCGVEKVDVEGEEEGRRVWNREEGSIHQFHSFQQTVQHGEEHLWGREEREGKGGDNSCSCTS